MSEFLFNQGFFKAF